ncbi:MAG: DNA-directed RNA polymerase subunit alpha [Chloroflexi bacterium]|nr:DNA-directed RNA polymerase subunit alpha [Chloroflexota bacterium]
MSADTVLKVECTESSDTYARFVAEPLESGEGITVGNALRRVLLNSLTGAAVTWIRIEGVQHEFSPIPHVKEDTMELVMNVKGLRLRTLSGNAGKLNLGVEGEGKVTAADIAPSNDFQVINPDLYLASLDSSEAKLQVELNVELGKGYIPTGRVDGQPIGVIPIDAIFSPVRKVNYSVEPTHVGQGGGVERLVLEVWTDGTISPSEAVVKSSQILVSHFSEFAKLSKVGEAQEERPVLRTTLPPEQYNMPLEKLEFSVRTFNCLKRGGVNTLGQLLEKSEEELMALRHFGEKSRQEVEEKLQQLGYVLPIKEAREVAASASSEREETAETEATEEAKEGKG